jgi:Amino acid transporters
MNGIYVTTLVACTAFFSTFMGDGKLYLTLYSMSGIACFFAWLGISLSHYRFRKAYIAQGRKLEDLKYKALWYPFGPICGMILTVIVIFGANIWVFQAETFSWFDFIANYSLIPVFVIVYLSYKYINKTKIVPLMECDFSCEERESNQVID